MKTIKRIVHFVLASLLVLALCPATSAADDFTIKSGVLIEYNGPGGDITIPNSVTVIGDSAFVFCSGLTSITIPNSVKAIKAEAFNSCTGLTSIVIPDSVTEIGRNAFRDCISLTNIIIPNSVTIVGEGAFAKCSELRSIAIPESVLTIGNGAFANCSRLVSINVDEMSESFCSLDGVLFRKDKSVLVAHPAGRIGAYNISSSVTEILGLAFSGCGGLTKVTIPNSVTIIGDSAFSNCFGLTSLTIPNSVTEIGFYAFAGCSWLTRLTLSNSIKDIKTQTFAYCYRLASITIPNSVTTIGDLVFYDCTGLRTIIIPDSVVKIHKEAFLECYTDITIYGIAGTYVEDFAEDMSMEFVAAMPLTVSNVTSKWARPEIISAIAKGFVPEDMKDDYTKVITRQEFCCLAMRFVEYAFNQGINEVLIDRGLSSNPDSFSDTSDPYILAAFALGITNGTKAPTETEPGLFSPDGQLSRQEAATMLMRVCRIIGMDVSDPPASDFVDMGEAESWAQDGINFVRANGIMGGTNTTTPTFSPKGTYTRQESVVTFDRISF